MWSFPNEGYLELRFPKTPTVKVEHSFEGQFINTPQTTEAIVGYLMSDRGAQMKFLKQGLTRDDLTSLHNLNLMYHISESGMYITFTPRTDARGETPYRPTLEAPVYSPAIDSPITEDKKDKYGF